MRGHVGRTDRAGRMERLGRIVLPFMFLVVIADRTVLYADDSVRLMVGRSAVVSMGSPIARVSLTSADVADALVTSPTELLINGKTPGTISMFVWDRAGAIKRYEVIVQRDLARLSEQMKQVFPEENIEVQSNGRNIALSGTVSNKDVIERAINLSTGYVEKKDDVVSLLTLQEGAPTNQVLLKVRFAEVSRSALTELGAGFFTSPTGVNSYLGRTTTGQFAAPTWTDQKWTKDGLSFGDNVTSAEGKFSISDFLNLFFFSQKYDLGAAIRALQQRGLFESLAEPNLVAESGKEASFLAGGEFPVPIAQPSAGTTTVTVQFKEFGIRLTFTPVVNGNRVHLKVRPEVSTLDFGNAVTLGGFRIPALSTRRTETELELMDGQTFAIAGLMNNTMSKTLQKIPGIGDIPILGLLFKSQAAQKERTELVVMITPHILPNNSRGVTAELPRTPESFLPPDPERKTMPMPPPAFTPERTSAPAPRRGDPNPAVQAIPAPQPVPPPPAPRREETVTPAAAAATVQALTPSAAAPKMQAPAAAPANAPLASTPTNGAGVQAASPAGKDEHQRLESGKAADGKQRAKQIEEDRRKAEADKKAEEKAAKAAAAAARRQAEIDRAASAAAAKRAAEEAKKQAEIDKKNRKAVAEAEARLKAAEAAYQTEVAKSKKQ